MGTQYSSWQRQRAFRKPRQDYAFTGMVAHVTVRLATGQPMLTPAEIVDVRDTILLAGDDPRWEPLALCVMPDHFHLLLHTTDKVSLPNIVQFIKWSYARRSGKKGLWQRTYHDRLVRDNEPTENHARYIIENPVKAGLCKLSSDWPGSWLGDGVL